MSEIKKLIIKPYIGVGLINLGMSMEEVRQAVGQPDLTFLKRPDSKFPTDIFRSIDAHVYYKFPGICEAIEFAQCEFAVVTFLDQVLLGRPFKDVQQFFQEIDKEVNI